MPKKSPSSPSSGECAGRFRRPGFPSSPSPGECAGRFRRPDVPSDHASTSEKAIEHYFVKQMQLLGLPCIKQFNPYEAGWPDRLIILPDASVIWVEFKSYGRRPTAVQQFRHETLRALRHHVKVISSREQAEDLVIEIKRQLTLK